MKSFKKLIFILICLSSFFAFTACSPFRDKTSETPHYWQKPVEAEGTADKDGISSELENNSKAKETDNIENNEESLYCFTLVLRQPGSFTETEEWDYYPHSSIDGELIAEWEIPFYGNTVYESVKKYFESDKVKDKIVFRLTQHRFYMFHECKLASGEKYNLETVYVDADGQYSMCSNYQSVLGDDGIVGTEDDLKVLTLVYRGWVA